MHTSNKILFKRLLNCNYLYNKSERSNHSCYIWFQRLITTILLAILVNFVTSLNHYAHADIDNSLPQISEGSLLIKTDTAGQYHQIPLLFSNIN